MKRVIAGLGCTALLLFGCSSSDSESSAESASPSPSSTPSPEATTRTLTDWAGEVCQARDLLELQVASVALGLDVDPQAGLDQLPELRAQVEGEVEVIQSGVDDLLAVVRAVPEDSPEVSAFVGEVDGLVGSAQASANEALEQLRNATEADNALLAGVAAVQAVAAAQSAYSDASEALVILNEVRNESGGPLSQAFDNAPECA
jgi:hypothetical protein